MMTDVLRDAMRVGSMRVSIMAALLVLSLASGVCSAQCGRWITSNAQTSPVGMGLGGSAVNAIARMPNGDFIIAGSFTRAGGGPANRIVRWNGSYYSILGAGVDGVVNALAVTPSGDLIVGGAFNNAGGVPVSRIARWNGSAWSAVAPGIVGNVNSVLALPDGDIVVAGTFLDAGGNASADRIARWDGVAWQPYGPGLGNTVRALARLSNGHIIAAGDFANAGGNSAADNIARWDGAAWQPLGTGLNSIVYAVTVLPNGHIVAGGEFLNAGGNAAGDRIALWDGANWIPLATGLSTDDGTTPSARAFLQLPGGDLLVGGRFRLASGLSAFNIARWDGSAWSGFGGVGTDGPVQALAQASPTDVLVGGAFNSASGVTTSAIASSNGTTWRGLGGGFDGNISPEIRTLAVAPDGDIVAAGVFQKANQVVVNRVTRLDAQAWSPLGPGFNAVVNAVMFQDNGDLIAGGSFGFSGPTQLLGIARWNGAAWSAMGSGALGNFPQTLLRASPTEFYSGGNSVAFWNGSDFTWSADNLDNTVHAMLRTSGGQLIVGGSFTQSFPSSNPQPRRVAVYNGPASPSWSPLGGGIGTAVSNDIVHALAEMPNGDIVVGGRFTVAGGGPGNSIARWNGASWSQFGTGMSGGSPSTFVFALAVMPNGDLVAGGNFTTADGNTVNGIARWNGNTWTSMGGGATCCFLPNTIYSLKVHPNGELLAGGNFSSMGTTISSYFARWTENGVPLIDQQPAAQTANVGGSATFTVTPTQGYDFDGPLAFQWRRNGVNVSNGVTPAGTTVAGATTATLSLSTIAAADAGQYSVTITNGCGVVVSANAALTINAPAPCPGDADGDNTVNFTDITTILANFGTICPAAPCPGDANGDLTVNFGDITTALANFGNACP